MGSFAPPARSRPGSALSTNSLRSPAQVDMSYQHPTGRTQRPGPTGQRSLGTGSMVYELETTKDELYYQHELAEAAAIRIRAIEKERLEITNDYEGRVRALESGIDEGQARLLNTNLKLQDKSKELTLLLEKERQLVEGVREVRQLLDHERGAIERVKKDYAVREAELNALTEETQAAADDLEAQLAAHQSEALSLKKDLVEQQAKLLSIRESKLAKDLEGDEGSSVLEKCLFRLELDDLMFTITSQRERTLQLVRLQRCFETHIVELRGIFRYYSFLGDMNIEEPFVMTGLQFEHLLVDANIFLDKFAMTKCFLKVALATKKPPRRAPRIGNLGNDLGKSSYDPIKDTNDKSGASGMSAEEVLMDFDSFLEVIARVAYRLLDASLRQTPAALRSQPAAPVFGSEKRGRRESSHSTRSSKKDRHAPIEATDLPGNTEVFLVESVLSDAKTMILDPGFSHEFNCTAGRAAIRPHRRQLLLHFANVLKKYPDDLAVGVSSAEEMTVHQWLTFCEMQNIFCDKVLSPAKAALIFVQVHDDHVFQSTMVEHAIDVHKAMAIAQAHEKKDVRKDAVISVSEFEECVARCAWSHGLGQRMNTMLDRFVAEKLEILVEGGE